MDPYAAVFNEYLNPSFFDDDLPVPNFELQYSLPSINYYQFKPRQESVENVEINIEKNQTPTTSGSAPQISLNPTPDISNIGFLDDSFDIQMADFNDPKIEKLMNDISEESLQLMAEQNEKFNTRFEQNNDQERVMFMEQRENINTKRKMNYAVKTFVQFLSNVKTEFRQINEIPPNELDKYLQEFYIGIRKDTKCSKCDIPDIERQYQPSSLHGFQSMINRFLRLNNYEYDLTKSKEFQQSRDCLTAKKKHLKEMGLGNRPNAAEALEPEDEEELYNCGAFGTENPDSLLSTLWFMNTVHFGLRGSHEHRQLKWRDIKLETDPTGNQCLVYNERVTKTRDGSNTKNTRDYAPKSWRNPLDERKCHVAVYLKYLSHRPNLDPEMPFYLGVNRLNNAKSWYKNQPLGEKTLQSLMQKAVKKSNIDKNRKLTNHSGRKTTVTRLLDEEIPITCIQQHTGHRSVESINNYAKNSLKTQQKMSAILSRSKAVPTSSDTTSVNIPSSTENINNTAKKPDMPFNFPNFFPPGSVIQGGTFHMYFGSQDKENHVKKTMPQKRKRKFVIESDSDSD